MLRFFCVRQKQNDSIIKHLLTQQLASSKLTITRQRLQPHVDVKTAKKIQLSKNVSAHKRIECGGKIMTTMEFSHVC